MWDIFWPEADDGGDSRPIELLHFGSALKALSDWRWTKLPIGTTKTCERSSNINSDSQGSIADDEAWTKVTALTKMQGARP